MIVAIAIKLFNLRLQWPDDDDDECIIAGISLYLKPFKTIVVLNHNLSEVMA